MIRRLMILSVLAAILAAPQISGALPRDGLTQTAPEQLVTWPGGATSATLLGSDSVGILTPSLQQNRQYRFEVTGTWKPTSSPTNSADAAFETTDGSNWSKTGRGFVVRATNMGAPGQPPTQYRSDHKYSITFTGRGTDEIVRLNDPQGYADNSGSVTVKIWAQQVVVWQFEANQPLPTTLGLPATEETSVSLESIPSTMTVHDPIYSPSDVGIPNLGIQEIARVEMIFTASGAGDTCAALKVTAVGTPVSVPLGCSGLFNGQQNYAMPVGGAQESEPFIKEGQLLLAPQPVPTFKEFVDCLDGDILYNAIYPQAPRNACNNELVLVPQQPGGPLPDQYQVIPPGSTLKATLAWRADLTRLWFTPINDGAGTAVVLPYNPLSVADRDWFTANAASLDLRFDLAVIGPNGSTVYRNPTISIPGVGQYIEAAFSNKVAGL